MVTQPRFFGRIFRNKTTKPQEVAVSGERETAIMAIEETNGLETSSHLLTEFLGDLHAVEGKKRGLVDFDLAPEDPRSERLKRMVTSKPTKEEVLSRFHELRVARTELALTPVPEDEGEREQYDFLEKKLLAIDTIMQRKNGAVIDFHNYIELTQGITPEFIHEEVLAAQLEVVKNLYQEAGMKFYTKNSIQKYRLDNQIPNDEVGTKIVERGSKFIDKFSEFLGKEINPTYEVERHNVEEWWINWADGIRNRFRLRVNTHKIHDGKFTGGRISVLGLHEIVGHFGQMYGWQQSIDESKLIDALGVTSVCDPEQVTSEGIGQTIIHFVPGILSDLDTKDIVEAELEIEQDGLRQMVYNNVHIWLNTTYFDEDEVKRYVRKYLPAESDEDIKKHINDRTKDEIKSSYLMSYGYGFYLHREYALCLTTDGKREFLKYIYSKPTTPEQEYNYVLKLIRNKEKRYGTGRIPFADKEGNPTISFPDNSVIRPDVAA